jgi:hypothetical protein
LLRVDRRIQREIVKVVNSKNSTNSTSNNQTLQIAWAMAFSIMFFFSKETFAQEVPIAIHTEPFVASTEFRKRLFGYFDYIVSPSNGEIGFRLRVTNGNKFRGFHVCNRFAFLDESKNEIYVFQENWGIDAGEERDEIKKFVTDSSVLLGLKSISISWSRCSTSSGGGILKWTKATVENAFEEVNKVGAKVENELCDIFTLGGHSKGTSGCGLDVGVGIDTNGPYLFPQGDPNQKMRIETPQAKALVEIPIPDYELEFAEIFGTPRHFLDIGKFGGTFMGDKPFQNPTNSGTVRASGGEFAATRTDKLSGGGYRIRFHAGVDYLASESESIFSPVDGEILRISYPNPKFPELTGVFIKSGDYKINLFYVRPDSQIKAALEKNQTVKIAAGQPIGSAQDISKAYKNTPNHIHIQILDQNGQFYSPSLEEKFIDREILTYLPPKKK